MRDRVIRVVIQFAIGGAIGWGSCWFFDEVLHLHPLLGIVAAIGVFVVIGYFGEQAEQEQQQQIAAAFVEQQRKLRLAKKKLARLKRRDERIREAIPLDDDQPRK